MYFAYKCLLKCQTSFPENRKHRLAHRCILLVFTLASHAGQLTAQADATQGHQQTVWSCSELRSSQFRPEKANKCNCLSATRATVALLYFRLTLSVVSVHMRDRKSSDANAGKKEGGAMNPA